MGQWAKNYRSVSAIGGGGRPLAGAPRSGHARSADPVAAILGGEARQSFDAFYAAVAAALLMHAAFLVVAVFLYYRGELRDLLHQTRLALHEYFWTQYDVDLTPKDKPKEEPKAEESPPPPEPLPAPKPAPKLKDDPYDQPPPPPTPAKAAPVLTQKEDPDKVEDLTGNTVVTGDGTATYGQQSASGTGNKAVTNPAASLSGVPGGRGTGPAPPPPPPPPTVNRSREAGLVGSTNWNCPFPPEADADQIDEQVVNIVVTVRPDGSPLHVSVVNDPGHGFGRAARLCALSRRYTPALDTSGNPRQAVTPPIRVRFTR